MKIRGRKLTAVLLALCIALALVACGSGGQEDKGGAEQLSGTVYVPKFVDLDVEFDYINGGCCDGKNAYILAQISSEEEVTDPETGETYMSYSSKTGIYRVDLETGATTELENYKPSYEFASYEEGWSNTDDISLGADGTLWVSERASIYSYDLPENFDEETDSRYNYQTSTNVELMRQLDVTGSELQSIDRSNLREKLSEMRWIQSTIMDSEGCFYVTGSSEAGEKVFVLDKEQNILFSMDADAWGDLITLGDGTIGLRRRNSEGNFTVTTIDKEKKDWGTDYPLSANVNNIYSGSDRYIFYYNSGESLYGYNAETGEGERLLSWSSADINVDRIQFFSFLEDGRVAVLTQDWGSAGRTVELALLEEQDASVLANKTVLTYATMGLNSDVRSSIIQFNKTNPSCRIEIRDYSEYATEGDYQAGLTKLNTEILGGNVPDILNVNSLPIRQYGAKGVLEDLWPYIDKDPEISRDTLMDRVFTAAEQDGKLYQVFDSFGIQTVIGSRKVVGDALSWTLADLQAALATMPEGCAIFGEGDTKSQMLRSVLAMNLDSYVDWDNGSNNFGSDAFKSVLEFCNSFPMEFDWENYEYDDSNSEPARIANGRQMLQTLNLSSFGDIQMYEAIFGGSEALKSYNLEYNYSGSGGMTVVVTGGSGGSASSGSGDAYISQRLIPGRYITYVGYPMEDGSVGSSFTLSGTCLAMSSTCKDKDAAWSFMRELLLPQADRTFYSGYGWAFPTNKVDFEAKAEEAMTPEYMTDGQGNQVLDDEGNPLQESKGGWGWGGLEIDIQATTQEEYDQVMELYNAIQTIYSYDTSIFDIISDLASSYFNGDKSLDETASQIQNRVNLYINESR